MRGRPHKAEQERDISRLQHSSQIFATQPFVIPDRRNITQITLADPFNKLVILYRPAY